MTIEARDVPRLTEVAARVHLARLADTGNGDVFYLAEDPSGIYECAPMLHPEEDYRYIMPGLDLWLRAEDLGDGSDGQLVVVLHNTKNHLRGDG